MSLRVPEDASNGPDVLGIDNGIEALRASREFDGPVESLDGVQSCNDHLALFYDSAQEQLDAVVPFVRQGLARGERVMYVTGDPSRERVEAALREGGVDVTAARASGALSFHGVEETYLRNGRFDPQEMVEFYADAIEEATEEFSALRVAAETAWLQRDAVSTEEFMTYEARINELFEDEDCIALCQYDRTAFEPAVVRDLVQSHPHLICDGSLCHNFYYTPPAEYFGPDRAEREVDRMLGTLVERAEARAALQDRGRLLRELTGTIADPDATFEAKLQALFERCCEWFDFELGAMATVDADADRVEVEYCSGDHPHVEPGLELPLSAPCCAATTADGASTGVADPPRDGHGADRGWEEFGIGSYSETAVTVDGGMNRTLFFVGSGSRADRFGDAERSILDLMGQWVKYELERQRRERYLRESYEITSDPDRSFDEKLRALLEVGRERFDLDVGFFARANRRPETLEIVEAVGDHDRIQPGDSAPLDETYCRRVLQADGPVCVRDATAEGWADDPAYESYGLESYVGTTVRVGGEVYGTVCFCSTRPRADEFTDAGLTFLELLSQWIEYELERQRRNHHQQALYELAADTDRSFDEKLSAAFELGTERFDVDVGGLARIDPSADRLEVQALSGDHDQLEPGTTAPLSETYCRLLTDGDRTAAVTDPEAAGVTDTLAYTEFGFESYLGTHVPVENDDDRTLFFVSDVPREGTVSADERAFLDLMGQWLGYELERNNRERNLRTLYEITADRETSFGEKLDEILSFGCERFGLGQGYIVNVHPDETVEIERAVGAETDDLRDGVPDAQPRAGQFCRRTIALDRPIGAADVAEFGWDDDPVYEESGLQSYLGVTVTDGAGDFGTLAFADTAARDRPFTDAEYTFLELMGQWVSHELIQRRREFQLAALNEMGREITVAETRDEIARRAIEHANDSLHLPVAAIVTYDGERGELTTAATTPRAEDELPTAALCDSPDGALWQTFVAGESRVIEEVADLDGTGDTITEVLAVPLGRQGLFVTATSTACGFSDAEQEFVETAAATVEAACTRADRERELHRREETLADQNETLERLNRVNDIIRNIDQALVGATSRTEIERVVCEQLAEAGPYELAWVGKHDALAREVTPKQWAGREDDFLTDRTISTAQPPGADTFVGRAVQTREVQVVDDVLDEGTFEPWREAALNRGYHACAGLPLVYGETFYGVLVVFAGEPGVFDDLERAVLSEMADTVAYAINAVESKKAIVSDRLTRLTFDLQGADLRVVDLCQTLGCDLTLESLVPGADGEVRAFATTRGVAPATIREAAAELPLGDVTLVATYEEGDDPFALFDVTLSDRGLFATALEHGARPCDLSIGTDDATLTIELAADAAVREFVEMLQSSYPGVELIAQRSRERVQQTPAEFFAGLTETLTERQLEALRLAHQSGYLEEPRLRSATELAEAMGISQPTFNSHLRAAHRKLCERLFDDRTASA